MGGAARPPMTGGIGQPSPQSGGQTMQQGSDYYRHLLDNQRQNAANVPAVQAAQGQPQTPPNRPGPTPPGFGGQQQGQSGPSDGRYQGAYDAYMQRFGGSGQGSAQQPPAPPAGQQPPIPGQRPDFDQRRPGTPPRPGIRMGGGYASRT